MSRAFIAFTLLLLGSGPALAQVTLIEPVNGYTLVGERLERFECLAFDEGKVLEVGAARALKARHADARVIDGRGHTLLPGLIDAHGHVLALGLERERISLAGTRSLAEALARVRSYARAHPHDAWLQGAGWNQALWQLDRFPTAQDLDSAVSDRPVVLERIDGHAEWLNSRALDAAHITASTPDPSGGRIERDAGARPTGVLVDGAMQLIERVVPAPGDAELERALGAALAELNAVGLTGVGDAGDDAREIALYRRFADEGRLTVRVYAMIRGTEADFRTLSKQGPLVGYGADRLDVRAVKLFADGALGSRGAALRAPYLDAPGERGLLFMSDAQMRSSIETALAAGYQVNVHAIGDAANHQVLDAFEAAFAQVGGRELRNRIEHAQVVALEDIPRFKTLDLIASMQPTHATSDRTMAEARLGEERLKGAYAWRRFLSQGTRIAGGSDFPVESPNPFYGWRAAVTRTDRDDQPPGGWHPEEAMTVLEAFRAFTLDAAYAEHAERRRGSLEPGKWADFILVDRDPFRITPAEISKVRVEQTWLAGERVH
ncbi:MAG TPA: amidohydrolase [Steroidobacteraceae bacterium]|nr:amidohydrolase [Steroidobacteraceae bacterium]